MHNVHCLNQWLLTLEQSIDYYFVRYNTYIIMMHLKPNIQIGFNSMYIYDRGSLADSPEFHVLSINGINGDVVTVNWTAIGN